MASLDDVIDFLKASGAAKMQHWSENLLSHLIGTYFLLENWGAEQNVCVAGLCHSIYGTERFHYTPVSANEREKVCSLIGEEAEELAYLFSFLTRSSLYQNLEHEGPFCVEDRRSGEVYPLTEGRLHALYHIAVANWLEQRHRTPPVKRYRRLAEFTRMQPFLLPGARQALQQAVQIKRWL